MFESTGINILALMMFLLLIAQLKLCGYLFPWTGLGVIIIAPIIFLLAGAVVLFGMKISQNMTYLFSILTWIGIFIFNTFLILGMYPQDFRPSAMTQLKSTFGVISDFENITKKDLELYKIDNFTRYDCDVGNSRELYIGALYKYQNQISRDGSHLLFGRLNQPVIEETNIESFFKAGQDKFLWWYLEKNYKPVE